MHETDVYSVRDTATQKVSEFSGKDSNLWGSGYEL